MDYNYQNQPMYQQPPKPFRRKINWLAMIFAIIYGVAAFFAPIIALTKEWSEGIDRRDTYTTLFEPAKNFFEAIRKGYIKSFDSIKFENIRFPLIFVLGVLFALLVLVLALAKTKTGVILFSVLEIAVTGWLICLCFDQVGSSKIFKVSFGVWIMLGAAVLMFVSGLVYRTRAPYSQYANAYGAGYGQPQPQYSGQTNSYNAYQPNAGYQQQNAGYQQPQYQQQNVGYQQQNAGYQQPQYQQQNAGYQQPAEPVNEQSVEPTYQQPVEPVSEQSVEPTYQQPVEPVNEQPVESTTDTSI